MKSCAHAEIISIVDQITVTALNEPSDAYGIMIGLAEVMGRVIRVVPMRQSVESLPRARTLSYALSLPMHPCAK